MYMFTEECVQIQTPNSECLNNQIGAKWTNCNIRSCFPVYVYLVVNTITETWNFQMNIIFLLIIQLKKFKILQNQQKFCFSVFISKLLFYFRSGHENHANKKECPQMCRLSLHELHTTWLLRPRDTISAKRRSSWIQNSLHTNHWKGVMWMT